MAMTVLETDSTHCFNNTSQTSQKEVNEVPGEVERNHYDSKMICLKTHAEESLKIDTFSENITSKKWNLLLKYHTLHFKIQ